MCEGVRDLRELQGGEGRQRLVAERTDEMTFVDFSHYQKGFIGPEYVRDRRAWRTDFGAGRRRSGFFSRGRSVPTVFLGVGIPDVFRFSIGEKTSHGYVVRVEYDTGRMWVTP